MFLCCKLRNISSSRLVVVVVVKYIKFSNTDISKFELLFKVYFDFS